MIFQPNHKRIIGKKFISILMSTIFLALISNIVYGQSDQFSSEPINPRLSDKWAFWIGGFFPNVDSSVRFDSNGGNIGNRIDFEDTLNLEETKTTLWGGFRWRISKRNQLEMEFDNLNRSGTNGFITTDLDFNDSTVRAGAAIDTEFDLGLARLTYGYSVLQNQKHSLVLKAGVHLAHTRLKISAFGDIVDVDTGVPLCMPSPCQESVESDSYTLPLPHFGLQYAYAFTPTLGLRTQFLGFAIKINDIKGTLIEVDLDLHYQPWKHFGFGGGVRYWNVTVEDKGSSFITGKLEYKYWGPALYLTGSF